MSAGSIMITFGEDLGRLLEPFGEAVFSAPGGPLAPLWTVVPTMSLRQWLDQELSRVDSTGAGGITANLRSIFPKDLVVEIERQALGDEWRDWSTEATSLRILGALGLSSFDEARRRAEAIDENVRWRPHLLEDANRSMIPPSVLEAMEAIDAFSAGPQIQRAEVLDRLRSGAVEGLPSQIVIFGLPNVPGGPRFLELIEALSASVTIKAFLPVPSIEVVRAMDGSATTTPEATSSWRRDADEATALWLGLEAEHVFLDGPAHESGNRLGQLQRHLADGEVLSPVADDRSIRLLGGFGDSRQVEQLRDALFEVIAEGVEPHEILVVSPSPTSFAAALERHWSYQPWDDEGGPRLPNELIEVTPERLRNRLGASLVLLRLIGNYATGDQIAQLLSFPAVARTLRIDFDQAQELARRADEGKLIFGISAEQRARFGVYPSDGTAGFPADMGTWERVSDAVAVATLYPPKVAERSSVSAAPLDPVGEPGDLALFGSLQPVLRIIEEADALRPPLDADATPERRRLGAWLEQLEVWMDAVASPDGDDDSFERLILRLEASLSTDEALDSITLTFEQLLELWSSMAQVRQYSRIFGRGGIVIAGLEAFAFAPFKVVCILGLDEEKLPSASLPSQVMSLLPDGSGGGARRPLGDPDPRRGVLGGLLAAVLSATETLLVSWNASDEATGSKTDPAIALSELLDAVGALEGRSASEVLDEQFDQARRHGFSGVHSRPRFDARLLRLGDEPPAAGPSEAFVQTDEISLPALQQFFRDPVGRHLRQAENVLVPRDLEASAVRPSLEVDHLTKHRLREAYVDALMELPEWSNLLDEVQDEATYLHGLSLLSAAGAPIFDELCRSEELTGDVPALFWRDPALRAQLDLYAFNLAFDLADHEVVTSAEAPELQAIDLGDLGRVTLLSAHSSASERFEPRRTISGSTPIRSVLHLRSKVANKADADAGNLIGRLIELLALRATNPDAECRVQTLFAPENPTVAPTHKFYAVPKGAYRLNPIFDLRATPASLPAAVAIEHLAILVDLYRRGLDEVLPIFRKTSEALALTGFASGASVTAASQWSGGFGGTPGESESLINQLLFPMTYRELTRETALSALAAQIGQAGMGVTWWWGTANQRMASSALRIRHRGFEDREAAVRDGINEAEDDKVRDKFGRSRWPLIEGGL